MLFSRVYYWLEQVFAHWEVYNNETEWRYWRPSNATLANILWGWRSKVKFTLRSLQIVTSLLLTPNNFIWVKVLKNGLSKICGRQPLKNLKWYGLHMENLFIYPVIYLWKTLLFREKTPHWRHFVYISGRVICCCKKKFSIKVSLSNLTRSAKNCRFFYSYWVNLFSKKIELENKCCPKSKISW